MENNGWFTWNDFAKLRHVSLQRLGNKRVALGLIHFPKLEADPLIMLLTVAVQAHDSANLNNNNNIRERKHLLVL